MKEKLELRMYCLTLYQLSGIQSAIQCGHAAVQYGVDSSYSELYRDWAENWKTFIFLNGGTSETLTERINDLENAGIIYSTFIEPDLYNQITAVSFIVDERVFNKEKYPDFFYAGIYNELLALEKSITYEEWEKTLGNEDNIWLREWFNMNKFRLAGA